MEYLKRMADHTQQGTLANRLRQKRFVLFRSLLTRVLRPLHILDVGGTENFWERMNFLPNDQVRITLLNIALPEERSERFIHVVGDGRDMSQFPDGRFDVVFSNSVIEHVGGHEDQQRMAEEVKRVGKRYFIQTPNRYFPIEPHFLIPFFHFLPVPLRIWLITHFSLGRVKRVVDRETARRMVEEIHMLSRRELLQLFPEGTLYIERLLGLPKSFIVYHGWEGID